MNTVHVALFWLEPEDIERLRAISQDGEDLNYEEWRSNADKALAKAREFGVPITRVRVDFDSLVSFAAREYGGCICSPVRAAWAAWTMATRN